MFQVKKMRLSGPNNLIVRVGVSDGRRKWPTANKPQLLPKTTLATPPAAKLPAFGWFITLHTSSYKKGGPPRARALCRILATRNALLDTWWNCLSLPLLPLFSRFLLPFIKKGQKPALFAVSSYWSSIHINNSSGRIMYTKACSNVPHSKSNWLLRTFVELLLSHRHLKRRKPGPILSPACYSFQKLWWYYLRQAGRWKIEWKKAKKEIKKVRKKENKTFLLPAKRI